MINKSFVINRLSYDCLVTVSKQVTGMCIQYIKGKKLRKMPAVTIRLLNLTRSDQLLGVEDDYH